MGVVGIIILAVLVIVIVKGWWPYLWREWLTSVDHKRIGVMYLVLALVMLIRGYSDAIMMRSQQAVAIGDAQGYLPPDHYDQIFSSHGTIMIFFVAMPFVIGLMNFVVPLQLGVRDVAFPVLNSVSFWLTASGALLINVSLVIGSFARTGWMGYPPLSELTFSPDEGVDYYLWLLQISGIGTLFAGINMVTTILKLRAPGMTYFRMPVFCWSALTSSILIVVAFPVLTATFAMLLLDRYLGFHFFTNSAGGNMMMYVNLFWAWGHPEVYILILPAFGVFSEVIATFSGKPLFSYRSMVLALLAICVLSFMVWLHHFFTMGEWATSSPPPAYNFAVLPRVETIDAFWEMKRRGLPAAEPAYETIEVPRNSPIGFITAFFAVIVGFSLIWYIFWLAILGLLAILATAMVFGWSENREREISAGEMARMERARLGLGRPA
jgi:cytochrome o ubiquinol oxidase subunit 1